MEVTNRISFYSLNNHDKTVVVKFSLWHMLTPKGRPNLRCIMNIKQQI